MRVLSSTKSLWCATSLLALGCAVDRRELGAPSEAAIGFHLVTAGNVRLDTLRYDLNTPDGTDVLDGTLDLASNGAELSFGVGQLPPGDYSLGLVAIGMHDGAPSPCTSAPLSFHITPGAALALPPITLTCVVQDPTNQTWSVSPGADIAIETFDVDGEAVAFTYTPFAAKGHLSASNDCVYAPIVFELTAAETDLEFDVGTSPDGVFVLGNPSLPELTYTCPSGGEKTLSLAATRGSDTVTKSFVVSCDATSCNAGGPICGNGVVEPGEDCDERTARCVDCAIHPTCGDGVVDAPEECDARALPTASCDVNCRSVATP